MTPAIVRPDAVRGIRLFLMDVDGVLTDGRLYFGHTAAGEGIAMKAFHVRDGLGLALLRQSGVATGIVTGRVDAYVRARAEELGMAEVAIGVRDKGAELDRILAQRGLAPEHVAYLGDDVNDGPAFARVGVPIAVADAHPQALELARFVTSARGGRGAVREVADCILAGRAAGGAR